MKAPIPAESGYHVTPSEKRARRRRDILDFILGPVRLALVVAFIAAIFIGGAYLTYGSEPDGLTLGVWAIAIVLTYGLSRPKHG